MPLPKLKTDIPISRDEINSPTSISPVKPNAPPTDVSSENSRASLEHKDTKPVYTNPTDRPSIQEDTPAGLITQVSQNTQPISSSEQEELKRQRNLQLQKAQQPQKTEQMGSPAKTAYTKHVSDEKLYEEPNFFVSMFCCCFQNSSDEEEDDYEMGRKDTGKSFEREDQKWLLPPLLPEDVGKKTLVLDLDETLVHSSFKPVATADFIIPVEIDGQVHNVYVLKRPGVDEFLNKLGPQFELVIFTASLSKYADPVMDILDPHKNCKHRLFRESCIHHKGNYVKDLSQLGRDLKDSIIIDNSPASYIFHPTNAIPISSWFNDPSDKELADLIPFLEDLKMVENVMVVLDNSNDG